MIINVGKLHEIVKNNQIFDDEDKHDMLEPIQNNNSHHDYDQSDIRFWYFKI